MRESPITTNHAALKAVVVDGARVVNGMPQYRDFTAANVDGLLHYIRQQARASLAK